MLFSGGESQADPGPLRRGAVPGAQYASADPGAIEPQAQVDPAFRRAEVDYSGAAPGTIVIDTSERYLYLVQRGGRAIRYGIGVGRPGFEWSGVKAVTPQGGLARLDPAAADAEAPPRSAALHAGRAG